MWNGEMILDADDECGLAPGILIHGTTTRGRGPATLRVILHRGATVCDSYDGWRRVVAEEAVVLHASVYNEAIMANGWEPHAQPSPAAYLPRTFNDMLSFGTSGTLRLFIDRAPRLGRATVDVHAQQESVFMFAGENAHVLRASARLFAHVTGAAPRDLLRLLTTMVRGERQQLTRAA